MSRRGTAAEPRRELGNRLPSRVLSTCHGAVSWEMCFCKGDKSTGGQEETPSVNYLRLLGGKEVELAFQIFGWKNLPLEELGSLLRGPEGGDPRVSNQEWLPTLVEATLHIA